MTKHILTQEVLKELLHYDPETGVFRWKRRDRKYFTGSGHQTTWNKRFSGKKTDGISVQGYVRISIFRDRYKAHRLAILYMKGRMPIDQIDHINGIRSDNRWDNLRECNGAENSRNRRIDRKSKHGVFGVFWYERYEAYQAYINTDWKRIHLGYHKDFFEAVCARKSAEIKYGYHENHGRR